MVLTQTKNQISRLKEKIVDHHLHYKQWESLIGFRASSFVEVFKEHPAWPLIQRRAFALAKTIDNSPLFIDPDDILAAHHFLFAAQTEAYKHPYSHLIRIDFPEWWDTSTPQRKSKLKEIITASQINEDYKKTMLTGVDEYERIFGKDSIAYPWPECWEETTDIVWGYGGCINHSVRDYQKVITLGFEGLLSEINLAIDRLDFTTPYAAEKYTFLISCREILKSACRLGQRWADYLESIKHNYPDNPYFDKMIQACRTVPAKPATDFYQAVQSLWFAHIITCWEDEINANSIGRIDQFLFPYYQKDINEGKLTREEAKQILKALWLKLYLHYDVQQMTLAGTKPTGEDATNELTYLCLEVTEELGFIRCLGVRLHKNSPKKLYIKSMEVVKKGLGVPFFFNDDTLIPALTSRGIKLEDARDYANIGCVETTIPGKANPHAVSNWINLAKCLELALNDGKDLETQKQLGPKTGRPEDFKSFDQLWQAYKTQVEYFCKQAVYWSNRGELTQKSTFPLPYRSILTANCISRARDITNGGAIYNFHSATIIGVPNVADSLEVVRELIFTRKELSLPELVDICKRNFEGYEPLRQKIINDIPKYGNDEDSVDSIAYKVCEHICNHFAEYKTHHNGTFVVHLFSFYANVKCGNTTAALPDGRKKGQPLAYSLSPMQGRDKKGLTAVFKSLSKLPHYLSAGSSSAIVELDPIIFEAEEGIQKMAELLQTAIIEGVGQVQFNVVSEHTLRQAQKEPEKYSHITVRVSGFSAKFADLTKDIQDHIIARIKHRS